MNTFLKRFLFLMTILLMSSAIHGNTVGDKEQLFYYSFDKKIYIEAVPGRFMLKKRPEVDKEELESIVSSYIDKAQFAWFNSDICSVFTDEDIIDKAIEQMLSQDAFVSARRVYVTLKDKERHKAFEEEPLSLGLNDQVVVKYKDGIEESVKKKIAKTYGLTEFEDYEYFEMYHVSKHEDILKLSTRLFETGYFEYAYPQLISRVTFCDDLSVYPNDPYFQYQVTLHNTGQMFNGHTGTVDADIDAPEAWALTMGSEDIIIAVIDEGVSSNHPDLPNSRQIRLHGSNFGLGDPNDPSPTGNHNHGNACAGVIAATANNGEGIAGIAPLCQIMPIRFDSTSTAEQLASAICFAASNGANIITNSWGYWSDNTDLYPCIVNAINDAVNNNALVVFAAGNTAYHYQYNIDGYVTFPANRNKNGMLTVGASDRYDQQSDYSPTSSYIDIVAPSHRAYDENHGGISGETFEMWSLDIPGSSGYNPWNSDLGSYVTEGETLPASGTNFLSYTGHFGGTSHSCPVVAGVAALVLSVNPDLTPQAVCNILKSSADKVGGYTYVNGRCNEMGYGRVNANNAVWLACDTTFFVNTPVYYDTDVTGCDVYLENDYVVQGPLFRVKARNNVLIKRDFFIDSGCKMKISHF